MKDTLEMRSPRESQGAPTVPRGPPRKPKQSGHALWVGNLPPGTTILPLKDHFSKGFARDIESVFLISKSNCAFVNYRSQEACEKAMQAFHDSKFGGVRLVCRLRKGSGATPGVPNAPAAMGGGLSPGPVLGSGNSPSPTRGQSAGDDAGVEETEVDGVEEKDQSAQVDGVDGVDGVQVDGVDGVGESGKKPARAAERYFIVKSLTLQDLDQSVRNGIWATQSHNEEALNKAYEVSLPSSNNHLVTLAKKSRPQIQCTSYSRRTNPENISDMQK